MVVVVVVVKTKINQREVEDDDESITNQTAWVTNSAFQSIIC